MLDSFSRSTWNSPEKACNDSEGTSQPGFILQSCYNLLTLRAGRINSDRTNLVQLHEGSRSLQGTTQVMRKGWHSLHSTPPSFQTSHISDVFQAQVKSHTTAEEHGLKQWDIRTLVVKQKSQKGNTTQKRNQQRMSSSKKGSYSVGGTERKNI